MADNNSNNNNNETNESGADPINTTSQIEHDASIEIEQILGKCYSKPKHIGEGLTSGVAIIIRGTVGAVGTAILMPVVGAAHGTQEMGVSGAVLGTIGGLVGGVIKAANKFGGAVVAGSTQIVKGTVATPAAISNPIRNNHKNHGSRSGSFHKGNKHKNHVWWNSNEGKWVTTNLLEEERWVSTQARYDEDILGVDVIPEHLKAIPDDSDCSTMTKRVKDPYYYDLLNLDPSVDSAMIKRRYFIIARKYSPDRCGANPAAQKEFQEIGNAYMVLMNDELREKYDRVGRAGLWKEEIDYADDDNVDPIYLYTMMFGSEKFDPYIGRLVAATTARVGEDHPNVSYEEARLLQKRRVTRLALQLADRLAKYAEDDISENSAKAEWKSEAQILCNSSYGPELLRVIGKVYALSATQFLGAFESGIGMPSISLWAKSQISKIKEHGGNWSKGAYELATAGCDTDKHHFTNQVQQGIAKSDDDPDLEVLAFDILKKSNLQKVAIEIIWSQTVVDISSTLHEAIQHVLHDSNVSSEIRKKRGQGLLILGEIFQEQGNELSSEAVAKTVSSSIKQQELEEIAFHAMLDTVWRQEMQKRQNRYNDYPQD